MKNIFLIFLFFIFSCKEEQIIEEEYIEEDIPKHEQLEQELDIVRLKQQSPLNLYKDYLILGDGVLFPVDKREEDGYTISWCFEHFGCVSKKILIETEENKHAFLSIDLLREWMFENLLFNDYLKDKETYEQL